MMLMMIRLTILLINFLVNIPSCIGYYQKISDVQQTQARFPRKAGKIGTGERRRLHAESRPQPRRRETADLQCGHRRAQCCFPQARRHAEGGHQDEHRGNIERLGSSKENENPQGNGSITLAIHDFW